MKNLKIFFAEEMLCFLLVLNHFVVSRFVWKLVLCSSYLIKFSEKIFGPHNFLRFSWVEIYENKNFICFCLSLRPISNFLPWKKKLAHCAQVDVKKWSAWLKSKSPLIPLGDQQEYLEIRCVVLP